MDYGLYQKVVLEGVSKTVSPYLHRQITGIVSVHSWEKKNFNCTAFIHQHTFLGGFRKAFSRKFEE